MKLTYTLTLKDFKAAQALHRRQKFVRQLAVWAWPALTFLGLIGMFFASINNYSEIFSDSISLTGGALFLTIWMPVVRWYSFRRAFKQLFPPTRTDRSTWLDIDDERIISTIPGVSEGRFFWSAILAFAQDEKVTLLYIRKNAFLFIPNCAFSTTERAELNDLVARHVKKRG
jgi:hypothetical protein